MTAIPRTDDLPLFAEGIMADGAVNLKDCQVHRCPRVGPPPGCKLKGPCPSSVTHPHMKDSNHELKPDPTGSGSLPSA